MTRVSESTKGNNANTVLATVTFDEQREKDIQKICNGILTMCVQSTGDYGMGGECPFCRKDCRWDASLDEIEHEPDCIFLIAKDVSTGLL